MAEELTGSPFGFIGELNDDGLVDTLAVSEPGQDACMMPALDRAARLRNMVPRGIWGEVLGHGR